MYKNKLDDNALKVLEMLESAGYSSYAVGGCVRDIVRGEKPHDIDITTIALPEEVKNVFKNYKVIETGISHGTVTVLVNSVPFEITTFRCDGEYNDSRHPSSVFFTTEIEEDLKRRDFTVNSMAMDRYGNIIDPFGGIEDINRKIIRCTGNPDIRFSEDALRIMRALRFSSVLGFDIECETANSIHNNRSLLNKISVERIYEELKKLLCGKSVCNILTEFSDVICTVIPELSPSVGFDHMSIYHKYDVYTHIAKAVEAAPFNETVRLTMLFHDIGKPYVCTFDGIHRHFKGHPELSETMARNILKRFHTDNNTINTVALLCKYHDRQIKLTEKAVKRLLCKMSYEELRLLCFVKKADAAAHKKTAAKDRGDEADIILGIVNKLEKERACVNLKDLAVNGNDVISCGLSGPDVGKVLDKLLNEVINEITPNEKTALKKRINELCCMK